MILIAIELATGYISLAPSAKGIQGKLNSELGAAGDSAGKAMSGGITSHLKAAALGAGAIFAGIKIGGFLKDAIGEFTESARVGRLTESVIKSTGGAANVTAAQIGDLANALAAKTGVDDEVIQSGENVLATFTNVRNEVGKGNDIFSQATVAATDMSAALGQDMQSSVIQLGKALNDPVKGITALSRVGVSFTEQQKNQIKTLVESGNVLGAQKVILGELSKEFGGAAEAAADPISKLKVVLGNAKEEIGGAIFPIVEQIVPIVSLAVSNLAPKVAAGFAKILPAVKPIVSALIPIIVGLVTTVSTFASKFGPVIGDLFSKLSGTFQTLMATIGPLLPKLADSFASAGTSVVRDLLPAVPALAQVAETGARMIAAIPPDVLAKIAEAFILFAGAKKALGPIDAIAGAAAKALTPISTLSKNIKPLTTGLTEFGKVSKGIASSLLTGGKAVVSFGKSALTAAAGIAKQTAAFVAQKAASIAGAIATKALAAAQWLLNAALDANPIVLIVAGIAALVAGVILAYQHFKPFRDIVDAVASVLGDVLVGAFNLVKDAVTAVVGWIIDNWPLAFAAMTGGMSLVVGFIIDNWDTIVNVVKTAIGFVWGLIQTVVGAIVAYWQAEWTIITTVVSFVWGVITGAISAGLGLVRSIFDGFVGAFAAAWNGFWGGLSAAVQAVAGPVASAFDAVIGGIRAVWNGFRSVWNSIQLTLPGIDFGPVHIGGKTIGLPDLPKLWRGGIVPGSPGGTPVIAGDRNTAEAIIPLPKLDQLAAGTGGVVINFQSLIPDAAGGRRVVELIRQYERGSGTSWRGMTA